MGPILPALMLRREDIDMRGRGRRAAQPAPLCAEACVVALS